MNDGGRGQPGVFCNHGDASDGPVLPGLPDTNDPEDLDTEPAPASVSATSTLIESVTPEVDPSPHLPEYPLGPVAALHRRAHARWVAVPDNMRGSIFFVISIAMFSVMMAAIKEIGTGLPLTQTLLIRQVILTLMVLPLFAGELSRAFRTAHPGKHLVRGLFCLGSQYTYFLALLYLPLAEMTALGFSQVIFMTITAVLILKEKVGWQHWAATLVGFLGVVIMLKPTGDALNAYALVAVLSAALLCGVTVSIRLMAHTESTHTVMLYQSVVLCTAYAVPTFLWWEWPSEKEWLLLLVIGIVGTVAQYFFTLAFRLAEAAALAPLEFTRLLIAIAIGYLLFSEVPEFSTLFGATIVVGTTIYTLRRSAQRSDRPDERNA